MRILITGASGMLGFSLAKTLYYSHEVYCTGRSNLKEFSYGDYLCFDLFKDNINDLIAWANPEMIIHCAAMTNANDCNMSPELAYEVNAFSMRKMLQATNENVHIVYISTDAVFPSAIHLADEESLVSPSGIYGKSKELAEFFLFQSTRKWTILRTTIVGVNESFISNSSFANWIISSLENGKSISLFDDVVFTPITTWDLIKEIKEVIIPRNVSGVFHIAGQEIASKYQFGIQLARRLELDVSLIERGEMKKLTSRNNRSMDQTLSVERYQSIYKRQLPNLKQTIESIKFYYEKNKVR